MESYSSSSGSFKFSKHCVCLHYPPTVKRLLDVCFVSHTTFVEGDRTDRPVGLIYISGLTMGTNWQLKIPIARLAPVKVETDS
jgi:hypothetical protein